MNNLKLVIQVAQQIDGYVFATTLQTRQMLKRLVPESYPANRIFVNYDTQSDFSKHYHRLENFIMFALLGLDNLEAMPVGTRIDFIDNQNEKVLHSIPTK